ncbi:MAG: HD domain-containing protein [Clostridia bacterium]
MNITYPQELARLASYFPPQQPLFIVGGFVRDCIIKSTALDDKVAPKCSGDIDIASALTPDQLLKALDGSPFVASPASARLGTMIIHGEKSYEYTTFRADSYPVDDGAHTPLDVTFCNSVDIDASRRDFKCNAIYYDILADKLIDPLGGIEDIKTKTLSTCLAPSTTLAQDGLRIMRLFRFCATLEFSIAPDTYDGARDNINRLLNISPERIASELNLILNADNCFNVLCLLNNSGVLNIILPELADNDGVFQNPKFHKFDVLTHSFWTTQYCPKAIRIAGLLHDVAKTFCQKRDGNMCLHAFEGAKMTEQILLRLKYPTKTIRHISRLVATHMYDLNGDARESKIRTFVANNFDIIDDIIALKIADGKATGFEFNNFAVQKLLNAKQLILSRHLPVDVHCLAINGDDLRSIGYVGKKIGATLAQLAQMALLETIENNKRQLFQWAMNNYKK